MTTASTPSAAATNNVIVAGIPEWVFESGIVRVLSEQVPFIEEVGEADKDIGKVLSDALARAYMGQLR